MIQQCALPDAVGVAVRLASYVDCQSRMLGENGFQALVGGPEMASILSGLVAIFVALIGYRLLLNTAPTLRDGVSLTARLGIVLALVTSWPAFQTLVYRVTTDGPVELAAILLPASGLPSTGIEQRVQAAYDAIRGGPSMNGGSVQQTGIVAAPGAIPAANALPAPAFSGFQPLPQTASLFVMSTVGFMAALHLVVGFLLAVAPFGILSLLFNSTLGIFNGWVRAIVGAALGVLAASIASAIELSVVEMEVAHMQAAGPAASDPQAIVTAVLCFVVVAIAMAYAAFRMAGAFRLPWGEVIVGQDRATERQSSGALQPVPALAARETARIHASQSRAEGVADALAIAAHRDRAFQQEPGASAAPPRRVLNSEAGRGETSPPVPLGVAGRRSTQRRTRSATRRDRAL